METGARKKLLVHVGIFKTGTTSIQYFLNSNMYHLFEQGFYYPSTGRHPRAHVQHTLVSDSFTKVSSAKGDFALANGVKSKVVTDMLLHELELAGRSTNILSSESFCLLDQESVEQFAVVFKDYDIRPIIYLRNLVDLADASYQTRVMTNSAPKSSFIKDSGFYSWPTAFDVFGMCARWANISGNGKLIVRDFDRPNAKGVVSDFCDVINIDIAKTDQTYVNAKLNKSVSMSRVLLRHKLQSLDSYNTVLEERILSKNSDVHGSYIPVSLQRDMFESYVKQIDRIASEIPLEKSNIDLNKVFKEKQYIGGMFESLDNNISEYQQSSSPIGRFD
jgi:hypothetical protein